MRMIVLPTRLADEIVQHARDEAPNECCGILLGKRQEVSQVHRTRNLKESPVEYELDPQEHIDIVRKADKADLDIIGFYHSHTFSEAHPSITDISKMSDWGYFYLIASLADESHPTIKAFWYLGREIIDPEARVKEVIIRSS